MESRKEQRERFTELLEKNKGIIHKISLMYTSTIDDKEDLYQEICFQLWRSYGNYREISKFSTWLYRIALNTAISSVRRKKRSIEMVELNPEKHYLLKDTEKEDQTRNLFKALSMLNKIDRAIILLWLEKKKYDEISQKSKKQT
jgi:RNA polymerase sigma-70 factor (ECF subfamily)